MASHNDLRGTHHIPDFPDQAAITAFLRGLLGKGRTQVSWASDAGIPYNSFTNWFTAKPPAMSAESLLRVVKAAGAEDALADWLRSYDVARGDEGPGDSPSAEGATTKPVPPDSHSTPHVPRPLTKAQRKALEDAKPGRRPSKTG